MSYLYTVYTTSVTTELLKQSESPDQVRCHGALQSKSIFDSTTLHKRRLT